LHILSKIEIILKTSEQPNDTTIMHPYTVKKLSKKEILDGGRGEKKV